MRIVPPATRRRQPGVHAILSTQGYTLWHHSQQGSHWLRLQPRGAWQYKTHNVHGVPQGRRERRVDVSISDGNASFFLGRGIPCWSTEAVPLAQWMCPGEYLPSVLVASDKGGRELFITLGTKRHTRPKRTRLCFPAFLFHDYTLRSKHTSPILHIGKTPPPHCATHK